MLQMVPESSAGEVELTFVTAEKAEIEATHAYVLVILRTGNKCCRCDGVPSTQRFPKGLQILPC